MSSGWSSQPGGAVCGIALGTWRGAAETGDGGGTVVATGTPEEIVKVKKSYTGEFLKPLLEKAQKKAA